MQNDILFDNIYIGHSIADALSLQKETFDIKHASEIAQEEKERPKEDDIPKSPSDLKFMEDPVTYVKEKFDLFVQIAKRDPVEAIKFVPEIAGALGVGVVTIIAILAGLATGGAKAAPSKDQLKAKADETKDTVKKTADEVANNISTGVSKAQDEVNKRTTRSATKDE